MKTVQLSGGPMDGLWQAFPDDANHVTLWCDSGDGQRAMGFYAPSGADVVWKWNGLYG